MPLRLNRSTSVTTSFSRKTNRSGRLSSARHSPSAIRFAETTCPCPESGTPHATFSSASVLRERRRARHDLGIHRELPVIAPFDFFFLSEPLQQADPAAAGQPKALREPEFGIHLSLLKDHSCTGIEARQEQPPGDGIGGLGFHPCPLVDRKSTRLNSSHLGISY